MFARRFQTREEEEEAFSLADFTTLPGVSFVDASMPAPRAAGPRRADEALIFPFALAAGAGDANKATIDSFAVDILRQRAAFHMTMRQYHGINTCTARLAAIEQARPARKVSGLDDRHHSFRPTLRRRARNDHAR